MSLECYVCDRGILPSNRYVDIVKDRTSYSKHWLNGMDVLSLSAYWPSTIGLKRWISSRVHICWICSLASPLFNSFCHLTWLSSQSQSLHMPNRERCLKKSDDYDFIHFIKPKYHFIIRSNTVAHRFTEINHLYPYDTCSQAQLEKQILKQIHLYVSLHIVLSTPIKGVQ